MSQWCHSLLGKYFDIDTGFCDFRKLIEVRAENAEALRKRRIEAEEATRLMKDTVLRKVEVEESRNGEALQFFSTRFVDFS